MPGISVVVLMIACLAMALALAMAGAWLLAWRTGNSGWVDAIWSFAVGLSCIAAAVWPLQFHDVSGLRQGSVAFLIGFWSMRLGGHIARRSARGGDDPRYAELKRQWGRRSGFRLFWFLQVQAVVALALAVSVCVAAHAPGPFGQPEDIIGLAILALAIAGEGIADRQLRAFRRSSQGGVCDIGLWGYTRHPNYFFEWLVWLAVAVVAIRPTGAYSAGWISLAAPALMYLLLVHASGVPPLEAHMLRTRGAAFRDYQARVSAFWPRPALRPQDVSGRST